MRVEGADGHRHCEFGGIAQVCGNLQGLVGVLEGELARELEDAELAGDADVALDVLYGDAGGAFRKVFQQLVRLHDEGGEFRADGFAEQYGCLRVDLQPAGSVVGVDPFRDLVVPQGGGIHHRPDLQRRLVEGFPLVGRGLVHQDDEHGAVQGLLAVEGQVLEALELLRFLDHDQLALGHHREASGGRDHLGGRDVGAVADGLVEVFLLLGDAVLQDGGADQFGVIRLVAHQQIDGAEATGADLGEEGCALCVDIDGSLGHIPTKIRKILRTFVRCKHIFQII